MDKEVITEKHKKMARYAKAMGHPIRREMIIRSMAKSSKETYDLLENLLTWARSDSGSITVNKEKINVIEFIEKSVQLLTESANQKHIKINMNIEEDIFVNADRNMIETTIRNLISNSIKFTNKGGEILISAREYEKDKIRISVKDNGVGMNKIMQANLFENIKTRTTLGTNKEKGTGFGLLISKDFVERNNGNLSILSEEGAGTEAVVFIPRYESIS